MKFKRTALAAAMFAAGAFGLAGQAQAKIDASTQNTYDPEVFLVVWDSAALPGSSKTRIVDLSTPFNARSTDWNAEASEFTLSGIDITTNFTNAVLKYAVLASGADDDPAGIGMWFTTPNSVASVTDDTTGLFEGDQGTNELLSNLLNTEALVGSVEHAGNPATSISADNSTFASGNGFGTVPGLAFQGTLVDAQNGTIPTGALVGTAMRFFSSIVDVNDGLTDTIAYAGSWLLSATGTLTYRVPDAVAPVPLPAGVWLLGSALLGLAGVARRRRVAAAV